MDRIGKPKILFVTIFVTLIQKILSARTPGEPKSPKPPPKIIKKAGTVSFAKKPKTATKKSSKINVGLTLQTSGKLRTHLSYSRF